MKFAPRLNAVISVLHLLKDSVTATELLRLVDTGVSAGRHLLGIINDILDFSKMEVGRLELEWVDFDLVDTVEETLRTLQPKADDKNIQLNCHWPSPFEPFLRGDAGRLRQIIINLVGNAIKFTESGYVALRIHTQGQGTDIQLHVEVEDTGIGIEPDRVDSLFDEFTSADPSHHRRYGGTGLGLAICDRLVKIMGGDIGVRSEPGHGSCFYFHVTMAKGRKINKLTEGEPLFPSSSARVLLADDNPANQLVVSAMLERQGHRVDVVANGLEAVEAVARLPYDIVLMDISMPEMDGLEATALIRKIKCRYSHYCPDRPCDGGYSGSGSPKPEWMII